MTHHDGVPVGQRFEPFEISGKTPRQFLALTDDAAFFTDGGDNYYFRSLHI
ncbi:MAG: hypothetical protein BMS9Abin05_2663 [Rhodothermia bacterium]|nr:MAG: hypothetical protein BMS9Abin05_2663 [Rhodothermia bacterium]